MSFVSGSYSPSSYAEVAEMLASNVSIQFDVVESISPSTSSSPQISSPSPAHKQDADFASGDATWATGRNILVVFDSGSFVPLCEKHNVTYKTEFT